MSDKPVLIEPTDLQAGLAPGTTVITSPELVNAMIQDQKSALELLSSEVAGVSLERISVDSLGRVIVEDQAFLDALTDKLNQERATVKNGICGYKC